MLWDYFELINDHPLILLLQIVAIACAFGGIPPMIERKRRRQIENSLPSMLEALSDSIGAGLGLQQAMMAESERRPDLLGKLLHQTLKESHSSSFDAALANFSLKTRSTQVQRVMYLIATAIEQDAPLQRILSDLAMDYDRLNDLLNKRESELSGRAILIIIFVSVGLPFLIAFIVGLFTPASAGYQVQGFNAKFALFFGAASAVGVAVSGRMLGRLKYTLWWLPFWMWLSMILYVVGYDAIGG